LGEQYKSFSSSLCNLLQSSNKMKSCKKFCTCHQISFSSAT
jgi:hypothetical protein